MQDIIAKTIGNGTGQICDAVMMRIIPAINDLNDEVRRLQGQVTALGAKGPVATTPAPTTAPTKTGTAKKKKTTKSSS